MSTGWDGGSAFPVPNDPSVYRGMSLRDYFAAKALAAIAPHKRAGRTDEELADLYAKQAYVLADAMLKAREQK